MTGFKLLYILLYNLFSPSFGGA